MDLSALLSALGMLVLERRQDGSFGRTGSVPDWCRELRSSFPGQAARVPVEEVFPFLTVFLPDAEAAWRSPAPGAVASELWSETSRDEADIHLQAIAMRVGDAELLLIRREEERFTQAQVVLQRARELHLTHQALMRETEEREILTHTIVHDLAAPLHSMLGALSLLDEMKLPPEAKSWIELGLRSAQRQKALIEEILDVFVIERTERAGLAELESSEQPTSLLAAARRVAAEQAPVAHQREVRLDVQDGPLELKVRVEPPRLFRVLANLIDNAVRASPPRGVVRIAAGQDPTGAAVFTVEDEGPGVPPEALPRLFQKLGRGRRRGAGTGLGLYFCRIAVEGWGGSIAYQRRAEGGARFSVTLPSVSSGEPEHPAGGGRDGEAAAAG